MPPFDSDKFIVEVEARPAIWDSRSIFYISKYARAKAWEELCQKFVKGFDQMEPTYKSKAAIDLQRRWKSFRDSYRRELKKVKAECGTDVARKEYMYFKHLSFLRPVCETNTSEDEVPADQGQDATNGTHKPASTPPPASPIIRKRKKRSHDLNQFYPTSKWKVEKTSEINEFDDPDKHFLLSLLQYFKALPEDVKLQMQGEFIGILQNNKQFQAHYRKGNDDKEFSVVNELNGNDSEPAGGPAEEEETDVCTDSKIFVTPLKFLTDGSRTQERLPQTRQEEDFKIREDDECSLFGKLVGVKLRKLDEVTRQYVMNDIGGTLFRASIHTNTHTKGTNSFSEYPSRSENSSSTPKS